MTQSVAAKQVVVGVDGSEADDQVLSWAADEAQRRDCGLLIVHARDVDTHSAVSAASVVSVLSEAPPFGAELLSTALATVAGRQPSVSASIMFRQDKPANLLVELSADAELIVLGTHGDGRFIGALLGSVSQKLAAHARCPVVVLPATPRSPRELSNTVVVGVSPTKGGRSALQFAFAAAQLRGADLVAVRSWGEVSAATGYGLASAGIGLGGAIELQSLREAGQAILDESLAAVRSGHPTVPVRAELTATAVDSALLEASHDAALLVVGCRHEDGHRLSRLGPFGSWLLHGSAVPIAVVGYAV